MEPGTILSPIIGFVTRAAVSLFSRATRGIKPVDFSATLDYNPLYDYSSRTYVAPREGQLHWDDHRVYEGCGSPDDDGFPFLAHCMSPFVTVVRITNSSLQTPLYVRDVEVDLQRVLPLDESVSDRFGAFLGNINAGGRGAEGLFDIRISGATKATMRVFTLSSATNDLGRLQIRIDTGRYAEILLRFWFDRPGKYVVRTKVHVRTAWRTESRRADGMFAFVAIPRELDWPDKAVARFLGGPSDIIEASAFRSMLTERSQAYEDSMPSPVKPKRNASVTGDCATEAY